MSQDRILSAYWAVKIDSIREQWIRWPSSGIEKLFWGRLTQNFRFTSGSTCLPMPGVDLARLKRARAVDNVYASNTSIAL